MAANSKADKLLAALQSNVGNWTCGYHTSGSNQPAAVFRELKKRGYDFEMIAPKQWAAQKFCTECGEIRSHYLLKHRDPRYPVKERIPLRPEDRSRIQELLDNRDAFTGASITSGLEIDHKIPWSRLTNDVDASKMSNDQLREHFQLLTKEHNALKDKKCGECERTGQRPPFLGIPFWYSGGNKYDGSCTGCGWHDGASWRRELSLRLARDE